MKALGIKFYIVLFTVFSVITVSYGLSFATNLKPFTRDDLIANADSIVVGKVVDEYSGWDPSGKFIVTYVKIRVIEDIKGAEEGAPEIIVKKAGGKVGNREMIVHGAPRFKEGEKTLLFLSKGLANLRRVMGFSLGKLRIIRDTFSHEEIVVNPGDPDLKFLKMKPDGKYVEGDQAKIWHPTKLNNLVKEIKTKLREVNHID